MMTFQICALPERMFDHVFDLTEEQRAAQNIVTVTANADDRYPCRVSLKDADPGETLILVNHTHLDVTSPYASKHAVYVRENATKAKLQPDEIPPVLTSRLLSVRAFDESGMIVDADVVDGTQLSDTLGAFFDKPSVDFIHVHFAKPGCYAARAVRA
ncbi:MAG: DUF1203 domain-containing protein [Paracoccaceae bacterium]